MSQIFPPRYHPVSASLRFLWLLWRTSIRRKYLWNPNPTMILIYLSPPTVEYRTYERASVNIHATPKVAVDDAQICEDASGPKNLIDTSTEIPLNLNFPPFPLATVEKLAPQPEPAHNFELPVHELLSQSSIDILTQVARSLPEMLPQPESQSGSIFEDESHDDYVGISTSSTPPITSTQSLELLVAGKVYDEAERVLDALLEVGTPVPPSFAYEDAAIWAIRTPASTSADMDNQIQAFRKWFSLIPLGPSLRGPRPRRSHEFMRLRKRIMLSPLNSLRLIMEFGLIAAEKGYAYFTYRQVVSVVCMYGDPDVALQYIDELRGRSRKFLEQWAHPTQVDALDNKLRVEIISVAIKTLAIAGRFDHAVQLIPDPTETHFHLRPVSYSYLVHKMEMTGDRRYIPHIQFVTQHKSEARHRSFGLKKMKKPRLALAIRCLASIGQFDLAIRLLPKLLEAEVGLITDTLDFLLTRLRENEGDDHSEYIDRISRMRAAMESMPVTEIADSTTPSSDMLEGAEEDDADLESATPSPNILEGPEEENDIDHVRAIEALTKAWCLKEAAALVVAHHESITKDQLYTLLLWKLKISYNPKYESDIARIQKLREQTLALRPRAKGKLRTQSKVQTLPNKERQEARPEEFSGEDILMASSISSEPTQLLGSSPAESLRTLRKGFRRRFISSAPPPNPLTVVSFLEAYLASGRTRAILLLRNLVFSRGSHSASNSYILAEMIFHARRGNPDLVINTFVTHFFIVGVPRDDLLLRLQKMERDPATEALWTTVPQMKLFPHSIHAAVVWRALLDLARDDRALEALYAKVLSFADKRSLQAPVLAAGIPLLRPPPAWKTGVDASAFTPFIRRMCRTFGTERGALILKDMVRLGIQPTIYQLTQLAIEYSRTGEVAKTFLVLDQVENVTEAWENTNPVEGVNHDEVARRRAVDPVFYRGVVRGFLLSKRIVEARNVERRMFKRYGYVPGEDAYADELYEDLRAAEEGPSPEASISDAQSHKYAEAPPSAPGISHEPASSAGG
ncbi:hypothetical protein MSAN_01942100 [Mycena sanguinolenta]|uniref:Pentatricopeptide repeat protein n=1 Tax=Mycena sanguinolenta TaxID=230812 RepID=A0A8H6XQP2_9AGAR|nr:hypothetical protein MSAN_01942100 [Mycena sanguinolenta]